MRPTLTREQRRELARLAASVPQPSAPLMADPLFVVEGRTGTAEVTLSVRGDVLLIVTGGGPWPEGRGCFGPRACRELAAALVAAAHLVEGGTS